MIVALLANAAIARVPPPVAPPRPPVPPRVWEAALEGRVPVWGVERPTLPLVRVEVSFDTLALHGAFAPGALDALGAVWGEGTRAMDAEAWRHALGRLGASASLGCGAVRCWAALETPAEALPEALELVGAVVRAPALPGSALRRWRAEARREWRTDWQSGALVHARALGRLTWPEGHPYREDRAADTFDVSQIQVRAAWRTLVEEAPTSVVVVGDVTAGAARLLIERTFGGVGRAGPPTPVPVPTPIEARHVFVPAPGSELARVSVAWAGPASGTADEAAYTLAFRALAGGFASRLNLRLREQDGLTYRVDGTHVSDQGYGLSQVELVVAPERLPAALEALAEELDGARAGFTEAETDAGRRQLWAETTREVSSLAGLARRLWSERYMGASPGASVIQAAVYRDVSLADVNAAAARWLATPRRWLVSGDEGLVAPVLDEHGWPIDTWMGTCTAVYGGACP